MTDGRQAWSDAGQQISALTGRLKEAFEQQRAAEARQSGEGPEAGGTTAMPDGAAETGSTAPSESSRGGAAKAEVQEAVRRLSEAAKDVFEVLGGAAKDPDVKADVKQRRQLGEHGLRGNLHRDRRADPQGGVEDIGALGTGLVGLLCVDCIVGIGWRDTTWPEPAGGCLGPSARRNPAGRAGYTKRRQLIRAAFDESPAAAAGPAAES